MKPITPELHGVLDYTTAGLLIALPRLLRWSPRVTQFMTMMAVGHAAYSLLTRYKYGVVKTIPMETHLAVDKIIAGTFMAAPLLMRGEDPAEIAALVGLGVYEMGATLMTEPEMPKQTFHHRLYEGVKELVAG
jgi:hypothetical protein